MGVPSLEAVLDVYAGTPIELHVEIKTDALGRAYEGLEKRLLDVIGRRKLEQQAIVTSFVPEILETVRQLSPPQRVLASLDRRSAELFGGLPAALDRFAVIGNCMVAVEKGLLADSLELCLRRVGGEFLGAWVPNDADDIARWLARPIRQITTDRPDVALGLRKGSGRASRTDGRRPCGLRPAPAAAPAARSAAWRAGSADGSGSPTAG